MGTKPVILERYQNEDLCGPIDEVIDRLATWRSAGVLSIRYDWEFDGPGTFELVGERQETEKEVAQRERRAAAATERRKKDAGRIEAKERAEWARLSKKYGSTNDRNLTEEQA